jgi:hypothetical protein
MSQAFLRLANGGAHELLIIAHRAGLRLVGRERNPELSAFMSPRAKQQLYHSLAQLLRAGIPFPKALEKLSATARGPTRHAIARIRRELAAGRTVAEACAEAQPMIGAMEAAVLTAVERAGSLDRGLEQLAEYFEALTTARGTMLAKSAYPIFILVLGVLLLNVTKLISENMAAYLRATLGSSRRRSGNLVVVHRLEVHRRDGDFQPDGGRIRPAPAGHRWNASSLCHEPVLLGLRPSTRGRYQYNRLAIFGSHGESERFGSPCCSLGAAGGAGRRPGWTAARVSQAFDPAVVQGIMVGEESGQLDRELQRLATEQRVKAFARLEALADWLPRLLYLGILLYLGWRIISFYQGYLGQVQSLIDQ